MMKALREAIAKVEALPEAAQEHIARELIDYVDKLNALRADLRKGYVNSMPERAESSILKT